MGCVEACLDKGLLALLICRCSTCMHRQGGSMDLFGRTCLLPWVLYMPGSLWLSLYINEEEPLVGCG